MPAKLSEKERIKLIERVIIEGEPVSKVCREAGISRVLFYRWIKRYKKEGTVAPKKRVEVPSRQVPEELVGKIVSLVRKNPFWATRKVSEALGRDEKGKPTVGNHGVQNVFARLNLNTIEKRRGFAKEARGLTDKQVLDLARGVLKKKAVVPRAAELSPKQRLEAIERVVKDKVPAAQVCTDFGISRPNFYKWLKRYKQVPEVARLEAMENKEREVERYYRQTPEKYEEAVLSVVGKYPEFGVARIVKALPDIAGKPIVGHHGVQNILRRKDLNTYEKRLAYAQAQVTPVTKIISTIVGLGTRFITLPTQVRIRTVRFASVALLTSFVTIIFLGALGYAGAIFGQAPTTSARLGMIFASFALSAGSIFFVYSMKYYLTLGLVLSFSRQPIEEGGGITLSLNGGVRRDNGFGNGNGKNWIRRIFGLNGNGPSTSSGQALPSSPEWNGRRNGVVQAGGLLPSLDNVKLKRHPFVSVHLPLYNEKKVVERLLDACVSMKYPSSAKASESKANFEIIVCDDSTDETVEIVQKYAKKHNKEHPNGPRIKILHRKTREGFKGGALREALRASDPQTEFVVVFDADFVPYPDTLELFVKNFKVNNNNSEDYKNSSVAVVGGYQWHVLNKSENWITRGVRAEYAGSYVIERPGREILGLLKQISGSVYMIRADLLKKFGWGTSITEDFQLTLRLYSQGYKVIYTPYIQAPAECVSTLKRLIRQRMRWAEGHSNNIKKMFLRLMRSSKLTLREKFELAYLSQYYLQAFFFMVGTFCWLMVETVFKARLPFWTSLWGWSLVLTNLLALPLMNAVGLFMEESEQRDYLGLLSFVVLSYILVPFQAYASVKGFIEKEEGPWFRTPKTGRITDVFKRGRFYRWITGILPGRRPSLAASVERGALSGERLAPAFAYRIRNKGTVFNNPYLALETANNRFDNFEIKPRKRRWLSKVSLAVLLMVTTTLLSLSRSAPFAYASDTTPDTLYIRGLEAGTSTRNVTSWQLTTDYPGQPAGEDVTTNVTLGKNDTGWCFLSPGDNTANCPNVEPSSIDADNGWIYDTEKTDYYDSGNWNFDVRTAGTTYGCIGNLYVVVGKTDGTDVNSTIFFKGDVSAGTDICNDTATTYTDLTIASGCSSSVCDFDATQKYLIINFYLEVTTKSGTDGNITFNVEDAPDGCGSACPHTDTSLWIPEKLILYLVLVPFIPGIVLWMKKKKTATELLTGQITD